MEPKVTKGLQQAPEVTQGKMHFEDVQIGRLASKETYHTSIQASNIAFLRSRRSVAEAVAYKDV